MRFDHALGPRGAIIPESSAIIEYLDLHHPGRTRLIPADAETAREMRLHDRFYDLYVNVPMQKIVTDKLRPPGRNDPHGVDEAKALLRIALGMIDKDMSEKIWAMGDAFTMANCAAASALFYVNQIMPFGGTYGTVAGYLARLLERPSFLRAHEEAQPYFELFPG